MDNQADDHPLFHLVPMIIAVVVALPFIAFVITGVVFLSTESTVCGDFSNLWVYSAIAVGFVSLGLLVLLACRRWLGDKSNLTFILCFSALTIYGGVIIYGGYTCSDMMSEDLWVWAQVSFYSNAIVAAGLVTYQLYIFTGMKIDSPEQQPLLVSLSSDQNIRSKPEQGDCSIESAPDSKSSSDGSLSRRDGSPSHPAASSDDTGPVTRSPKRNYPQKDTSATQADAKDL